MGERKLIKLGTIEELKTLKEEYRIRAYFTEVYSPRSYKGMVLTSYEDALKALGSAIEYYSNYQYLDRVVIESRKCTDWSEKWNKNK